MSDNTEHKGSAGKEMIIFTAPSGAGKTTLVRHLLSVYDFLGFSVSATTRDKRPHEVHGKDYYFLKPEEFQHLIKNDRLAEYVEVYKGKFYGTLDSEIERIWESGKRIVFDMDVKGATTLKKRYGDKCMVVFIAPPSLEILIERLRNRKTESEEALLVRIERIKQEITYRDKFDAVIVNDILDVAKAEAERKVLEFLFPSSLLWHKEEHQWNQE